MLIYNANHEIIKCCFSVSLFVAAQQSWSLSTSTRAVKCVVHEQSSPTKIRLLIKFDSILTVYRLNVQC